MDELNRAVEQLLEDSKHELSPGDSDIGYCKLALSIVFHLARELSVHTRTLN